MKANYENDIDKVPGAKAGLEFVKGREAEAEKALDNILKAEENDIKNEDKDKGKGKGKEKEN
jgi:hypothetical protein